jgi:ribosomal protein S18 acetylase RimI-like enzyme
VDRNSDYFKLLVVVDTATSLVVGAGTLLIEPKFIHACGSVGHIEDIVVKQAYRGKSLGKLVVDKLVEEAKQAGCYKVILDCSEQNILFYERCGFKQKEIQMARYFE